MKKIALLGLSGSIGHSTLNIVRNHKNDFSITFASVHNNIATSMQLIIELNISKICITGNSPSDFDPLKYPTVSFFYGQESLLSLLKNEDYDIALNAVTGSAGLPYSIEIVKRGKSLALANKESLVMAGHLIKEICETTKSEILPVDSEHSAIFQCLFGHSSDEIRQIHITASGGPFRNLPLDKFKDITLEKALKHPTWSMGTKVTLDSSTMFNKALEVIEAHWLFNLDYDKINAIIHPQSVIHSMLEFVDGSILAQLSTPSMELPILYALSFPKHIPSSNVKTNLLELSSLTFEEISPDRFPLFFTTLEAAKSGGLFPTICNAANEAALNLLLKHQIHYLQINDIVKNAVNAYQNISNPSLDEILFFNQKVYYDIINQYS